MSNPQKQQGTKFETWCATRAAFHGFTAYRLAEAGLKDPGDILIHNPESDDRWIAECKATANLNPHRTLAKAREKVENADLPYPVRGTVVIHKKLTRKDGNSRRSPDGEPIVVSMTLDDFLELI